MAFAPLNTVRGRLLILALLVEAMMLGFLIANSLRLVRDNMGEQARSHAEQIAPVLLAALVAPMAQFDYATVQAVLEESKAVKGIEYVAVTDRHGHVTAISGWPANRPLPRPDEAFTVDKGGEPPRYDVARPITLAGQKLGTLHFGLDLSRIVEARDSLLHQGFLIAGGELILSACLLTALGLLVTRQVSILAKASALVAAGGTAPRVPEGRDDIGRLGTAFNAMARAIAVRVGQLTEARDEMAEMADKLEHEHARLEALLAAMEFGILLSDQAGKVVYVNDALLAQWHLDPGRYNRGMALADFFDAMALALPDPYCFFDKSLGTQEAVLADGRAFTLHRHQVAAPDGDVLGNLWLFADVTEERRFEQQLVEAKEKAEAANVAKSRFLATMSHEIRTPLNGILGMAQLLLLSELTDQDRQDFARTILNSGQTLLALLNDILDLSKIEAGKLELAPVPFDPRQLVEEIATLFAAPAHAKGLAIDAVWRGPGGGRYRADSIRVRQMLSNLVSNAIKFTGKGFVRVEALEIERQGEEAVLEFAIVDSGIGIAAENQSLLFKPFSQVDNSMTREHGGTGLGLSIVRSLARLMGGDVGVESTSGEGSRFWFRIRAAVPAADEDSRRVERVGKAAGKDGSRKWAKWIGHVLVVEDNRTNRKVVEGLLKNLGVETRCVENGLEAVDAILDGERPSLVLMDVQMPVMDGFEATHRIRRWEMEAGQPRLPIIALTAGAFDEDHHRCIDAGMDDFLSKPINVSDLNTILAKWMEKAALEE